jgi:mRNA interferase HicA
MSYKPVRYVIDLLLRNDFVLKSQKGSLVKGDKTVVVPNHGSKGVEKGTYFNILNQAGIKGE